MADNSSSSNFYSKEALKNFYDEKIVGMKIGSKGVSKGNEIIDIVSEYPWTANPLKSSSGEGGFSFQHNIPYCYVVEHKQTVNSNIANFINTIKIGIDASFDTADTAKKVLNINSSGVSNAGSDVDNPIDTSNSSGNIRQDNQSNNTNGNNSSGDKKESPEGKDTDTKNSTGEAKNEDNAKKDDKDKTFGERLQSGASDILKTIGSLKDQYQKYVDDFLKGVTTDQLSSSLLSPYRYLYYTQETGKKYVFPMITPTELLNVTNNYTNDSKGFDLGGIGDFVKKGAEMIFGGQAILNFLDQVGAGKSANVGMEEYYSEMAKSFSFDPTGQELTINFPLFNTTKKDQWKSNYRFIQSFVIRNLPFKVSAYSYKPPLLYDIVVPGTTHLPLCYVSSIQVQQYGLIRMVRANNFIKTIVDNTDLSGKVEKAKADADKKNNNKKAATTNTDNSDGESNAANDDFAGGDYKASETLVPVPEAWVLTIKFKCLLSNSSNLMLDLANSPINISVVDGSTNTTLSK